MLKSFLRAAIATIEARTNKALLEREFTWSVSRWRVPGGEVLPMAPISSVQAVEIVDAAGEAADKAVDAAGDAVDKAADAAKDKLKEATGDN